MRITTILIAGLLANLFGCSYPIILVGPGPGPYVPPIESWSKADSSAEQRIEDSINCGGSAIGPSPSPRAMQTEQLPGENFMTTRIRLGYNWERCMLSKGYQYTGKCNPSDSYSSGRPACGAP